MIRNPSLPFGRSTVRRRTVTIVVVGVVLAFIISQRAAKLWTDFLWYDSVGLRSVWTTTLLTKVLVVVFAALVAFGIVWLNLWLAGRLTNRFEFLGETDELVERLTEWVEPRLKRVLLVLAATFALLNGLGALIWWQDVLRFFNPVEFGQADPIFSLDAAFYVFRLPLYRDLVSWLIQLLILTTLLVVALHYLYGGIRLRQGGPPLVGAGVKAHISILLAALALVKAISYRLDAYELVYSPRGAVFGAGYTDVIVRRPALNLLALISLAAAGLLLWNMRRRGWVLPGVALGAWLLISLVVGGVVPAIVQATVVNPDELDKEIEYVGYNLEFTRFAYDFEDAQVEPFAASFDLTAESVAANRPTIDNIRLWDPSVLVTTYSQLEEIRTYYQLAEVDPDRYVLDGKLTQVMVATRELDAPANLEERTWLNEHLVFTHGFGAVISPANEVLDNGEPAFLVQKVPPVSVAEELEIAEPRIYFGETYDSDQFIIVNTEQPEVDFPLDAEASFSPTNYQGAGGVGIGTFTRRLAFAIRYGDRDTLLTPQLTDESKTLVYRNVVDRVRLAAPLLRTDSDPYMVLAEGRLVWILDLYSVSDQYPYASMASTARIDRDSGLPLRFNYIRNSVKATVDAFDGSIKLYVVDPSDPLIQSYMKIFPEVFSPLEEMPTEVRAHIRYPEDLFRVQSQMYLRYHVGQPQLLYNGEDVWAIPTDPSTSARAVVRGDVLGSPGLDEMMPYYLLMRLPDEDDLSYLIMQPFNPTGRRNMASFLVAKSGPDEYGRIIEYRLPRTDFIDGPDIVAQRIQQDADISAQISLWAQRGSEVILGNMLVVPVEESVIYVQPLYLKEETAGFPEFTRAIVVFGDRISMEPTLDAALTKVFSGDVGSPGPIVLPPDVLPSDVEALLQQADALFEEARQALTRGDLGTYQEKVNEAEDLIEEAIRRLNAATA